MSKKLLLILFVVIVLGLVVFLYYREGVFSKEILKLAKGADVDADLAALAALDQFNTDAFAAIDIAKAQQPA